LVLVMAVGRVVVDEVSNPKKPLRASVRALVDTGVTYTVLPEELFRKLELEGLGFVKVKTGVGVEILLETRIRVKVLGGRGLHQRW